MLEPQETHNKITVIEHQDQIQQRFKIFGVGTVEIRLT